jgi:hypothetical protein
MYKKLPTLTSSSIKQFENLYSSVEMKDFPVRLGVHGASKPSYYFSSKWYDWKHDQREGFKSAFPEPYADYAVSGYFINFPAEIGRLDLQDYWVGSRMAGNMISYSLTDNIIYINDEGISVKKGEGITFNLREYHEVKATSAHDQKWACLMTMKSFI